MTRPQGDRTQAGLAVERMCSLAGASRASWYRHWAQSEPDLEDADVKDAIQRVALANRHYGYRRVAAELRREGRCVNAKRVLRMTREDNLLCLRKRAFKPSTTDSRHGFRVYANLAAHKEKMEKMGSE